MLTKFSQVINELYCQCFPEKTKQISQERLSKPWLTNHLLHQVRLKSTFFSMYCNGRLSNRVNILVLRRSRITIKTCFLILLLSIKYLKSCEALRELMGRETTKTKIKKLMYEGVSIMDNSDIADSFNKFSA